MRNIVFYTFAVLSFLTFSLGAFAATKDSEGYPLMYLRGTVTGWSAKPEYQFDRTADTYNITLPMLSGEFKIADDNWEFDFGGSKKGVGEKLHISGSQSVVSIVHGDNIIADDLTNVKISFTLDKDKPENAVIIAFEVNGESIPVTSGTLPVLYINVRNEDGSLNNEVIDINLSHKKYMSGEYWLDTNGCKWLEDMGAKSVGSESEPLPLEIKARGNYTRTAFAKKPFKLKLGSKQSLLGMSKSKHYAILAHADDPWGYMRNFSGFNLGQRIGLPWTPSQQPVEVVINGDYRGLYFLTESIRIESARVDIEELDDNATDPNLVSGGYLVELDNYDEDNQIRLDEKSCVHGHNLDKLRITWDTPEEYSEIMKRFVTEQFAAMNDAVGSCSDDLWSYMDLDDAVRYYLVEEIISNTESYHGSTYLFRDRGEGQKWHFSPIWDCGNAFSGPTDGFFYDHDPFGNTWIPSIRTNERFNDKLRQTWSWFMNTQFDGFYEDLEAYADRISEAAKADRRRWVGKPHPDGGQSVVDNSDTPKRLNAVKAHISGKVDWLKEQFGDYTSTAIVTEPERDDTKAAPLPEYISLSISDIDSECLPTEYFDLQGIKVSRPQAGEIYIVRRGAITKKEVYRD